LLERVPSYGSHFYDYADGDPLTYDPNNHTAFPKFPARRDTLVLPPQGYFVVRFVADNPGVWLFHCHIDWHLQQGLAMTFVEAPMQLQESLTIPQNHYDACNAAGVKFEGNAAGNTENYLDLSGQNKQVGWLPAGFTTKGIVALVFSCVSAFLGIAFISFYGASGMQNANKKQEAEQTERDGTTSTDS
jgi:iron transport multicopper oxidase